MKQKHTKKTFLFLVVIGIFASIFVQQHFVARVFAITPNEASNQYGNDACDDLGNDSQGIYKTCRYLFTNGSNRPYYTQFGGTASLGPAYCGNDKKGICVYSLDSSVDPICSDIIDATTDKPYGPDPADSNGCVGFTALHHSVCCKPVAPNGWNTYGQDACDQNRVVNNKSCFYALPSQPNQGNDPRSYATGNLCSNNQGICLYGLLPSGNTGSGVSCSELIDVQGNPFHAISGSCTQNPAGSGRSAVCCAPPTATPTPQAQLCSSLGGTCVSSNTCSALGNRVCPYCLANSPDCTGSNDTCCAATQTPITTPPPAGPCTGTEKFCTNQTNICKSNGGNIDSNFTCSAGQSCCVTNQCAAYNGSCFAPGPFGPQDCTDLGKVSLGALDCSNQGGGTCCAQPVGTEGAQCYDRFSGCATGFNCIGGTPDKNNPGVCVKCVQSGNTCTNTGQCCQDITSQGANVCDTNGSHTCVFPSYSPTPTGAPTSIPYIDPPSPPCSQEKDGQCISVDTGLGVLQTDPSGFVSSIFGILLSISGAIAILIIMFAGYRLLISQGDPEKIQAAKELLTAAIVGLLFLIFSFVILSVIGVDLLHFPGFSG